MKKMKVIAVLMGMCVLSVTIHAQSKFDKTLKKADKDYNAGNYAKALKTLSKYKKSIKGNQAYLPNYYSREARYNLAYGVLANFESNIANAISVSSTVFGENTNNHAGTLTDVAEIYNQYGYYRLAGEYASKALAIVSSSEVEDNMLKGRASLAMAEALIGQGSSNEALAILKSNEPLLASRAVEKETYVDGGKIQSRRIPEEELAPRFNSYARLLMLRLAAYGKKGDIDSVDVASSAGRPWISKNIRYMGETSLTLIEHDYYYTKMYAENNNGIPPAGLTKGQKWADYSEQLSELKKRTAPSVPLAHDLYLANLDLLLRLGGKSTQFANLKAEYDRMLAKYFGKSSLMNINLKAIEFNSKLEKDKTRNLENDAQTVLGSSALPKFYKTRISTLEFLYDLAIQLRRYANAESYLNQIIEQKKELNGEHSPEYHLSRLKLANFYLDYTNKLEEAGKIFRESYTGVIEKEIAPKHKDNLDILYHLASYYEITDKYTEAAKMLEKAGGIALVKYDNVDPVYAIALNNLAKLRLKIGDYDRAEADIDKSLKVFDLKENKDDKWKADYINAMETQAKLFGIKGLFDEAQDNLDRTRKMILKSKVPLTNELSTAEELSSLLIQLGKYSQTDQLLNQLIPEYERLYGKESLRLIDPLVNKGRILLARGDYTEADKIAQRANQIAVKTYSELSTKTAPTQKLMADIYYQLGDYEKAEENIKKAVASQEKQFGRNHVEVAKSLSQLALIQFHGGGDKKTIEKNMFEARDVVANKLGKDNPQYAEQLKNIAVLYISEKQYDLAFNSLNIAVNIWQQKTGSKRNINAASIYTLTGDVYYQQKNYKKAEEFYNKSKDLYERYFSSSHPEYVKLLSKLSKVHYMEKDYKRSKQRIEQALNNYQDFIKKYFPALSEREKAKYWNTIKGDFEFYNTLALGRLEDFKDLSDQVYNYQLLTKALLLNSSIKIRERILSSNNEELITSFNTWLQKKELLTLALSMSPAQLAENEIDPAVLNAEVERLERSLSQQSELFGQNFDNKKITFDDVKKSLKPNEVAIEMVRFRYFNHTFTDSIIYAALYIKTDLSKPKAIINGNGARMEGRSYRLYRNSMINQIEDNASFKLYWEPIQKELGQVSTIYLSADGVYNQVTLDALLMPDGKYVLDNSNIVYVSNTKDLYLRKVKSAAKPDNKASMFGNPTFYLASSRDNAPITQLPGTEREISQLQFLMKQKGWTTEEYMEKTASEEQIKELNSPKVFHVATHGFYKPTAAISTEDEMEGNEAQLAQNPLLRTGLLLRGAGDLLDKTDYNYNMENGILTAYEAMNLNLDRTDLVVLSACETGLGELEAGEGVFGLQRAFLVAGAKVLIMSMFKVDDEATQRLMLKFYQKWLNTNNMRQSFTEARKELRVDYPDPIYWGAFMMIGLD
jgi:CHAT domain-containing protein/tetratricopeptide (TPR) repeat protein